MHTQFYLLTTAESTLFFATAQIVHWKTEKKLGSLFGASLHVWTELDWPDILDAVATSIKEILAKNLPVISKSGLVLFKPKAKVANINSTWTDCYTVPDVFWLLNLLVWILFLLL